MKTRWAPVKQPSRIRGAPRSRRSCAAIGAAPTAIDGLPTVQQAIALLGSRSEVQYTEEMRRVDAIIDAEGKDGEVPPRQKLREDVIAAGDAYRTELDKIEADYKCPLCAHYKRNPWELREKH